MKRLQRFNEYYFFNKPDSKLSIQEQLKIRITNDLRMYGYHPLSDKALEMIEEFSNKIINEISYEN